MKSPIWRKGADLPPLYEQKEECIERFWFSVHLTQGVNPSLMSMASSKNHCRRSRGWLRKIVQSIGPNQNTLETNYWNHCVFDPWSERVRGSHSRNRRKCRINGSLRYNLRTSFINIVSVMAVLQRTIMSSVFKNLF